MKKCQPSPARYTLPTTVGFKGHDVRKNRMPAYSFGRKTEDKDAFVTPGPNKYVLPSIIGGKDQTFQRAPAHSLHARLSTSEGFQSPGPNAYFLQDYKPGTRAPAYSMGSRLEDVSATVEC